MKQSVLDRSVARATGESLGRIRRMGFVLLLPRSPQAGKKRCPHSAQGRLRR